MHAEWNEHLIIAQLNDSIQIHFLIGKSGISERHLLNADKLYRLKKPLHHLFFPHNIQMAYHLRNLFIHMLRSVCFLCVWRFVCVFVFVHMNDVNLKLEDIVFATFSFVFSVIFISSQLSISLLNKLCLFIPKFFGFGFNRCETFFSLHRCRFICFALVTSYKKKTELR